MANSAKRQRRLWNVYAFPGFRPQPMVRGVFGDPKARVIALVQRSKKAFAEAVVDSSRAGTTDDQINQLQTGEISNNTDEGLPLIVHKNSCGIRSRA